MSQEPPTLDPPLPVLAPPAPGTQGPLPLVEELPAGLTAWDAARRLAHWPGLLFLDSAASDSPHGRYSFVAARPFRSLVCRAAGADPLAQLAELLNRFSTHTVPGLPPFQGGVAGLFSYDLNRRIERIAPPRCDEFAVPELAVGAYDWVLAFDHRDRRGWLIATGLPETNAVRRRQRAAERIGDIQAILRRTVSPIMQRENRRSIAAADLSAQHPVPGRPGITSNFDLSGYLAVVRRGIEYVHAGDCFQVNLAQRLLAPSTESPLDLYDRLRKCNAAPFAGYFDLGDFVIASASPERFLRVTNGEVETRPIKGTRPRGSTADEDEARRRELLASTKDRAENVMIVDLLRNDLGRVCAYGTVHVEALCRMESFRYVHHLVSEVHGRLRPGLGAVDLLRAAFPGGSVTGAPKVRAMEIIAELEPTARGPYCGSLGYIGFDGSMDTNLLIRTFTIGRGWVQFPVGGGIVADSTPEAEYQETLHKAEGMLRALTP